MSPKICCLYVSLHATAILRGQCEDSEHGPQYTQNCCSCKGQNEDWSIAYKELLPHSIGMHDIGHQRMGIGS